jgi:drug/metabolite transporter (DMT)-like permease
VFAITGKTAIFAAIRNEASMGYLLFVTLIQAFSFSLIGEYLAGHVDSYFAVLVRVLAGLVFIPLTRWRSVEPAFMRGMLLIGALQFGVTYVCLYLSFRVLTVPEVLLFTVLTPLHVTLIEDALNRRFNPWALVAALVAVAGAAVIRYDRISPDFFMGFLLLQLANFTFAAGQVLYRRLVARHPSDLPHYRRFGYFYLGALAVVLPAFLLFGKQNFCRKRRCNGACWCSSAWFRPRWVCTGGTRAPAW